MGSSSGANHGKPVVDRSTGAGDEDAGDVAEMLRLKACGWGLKRIARQLGWPSHALLCFKVERFSPMPRLIFKQRGLYLIRGSRKSSARYENNYPTWAL